MLLGALFLAIVGALLNISELFSMAGALVALWALSFGVAKTCARRLRIRLDAPGLVAAGQEFGVRVTLSGTRLTHEMRFDVDLSLPAGLDLVEAGKQEVSGHQAVWLCTAAARRRGAYQIRDVAVKLEDPAGLVRLKKRAAFPAEVLAWPEPLAPGGQLLIHPAADSTGFQETGRRAQDGSSIHGVRPWAPGDTPTRVHWPSTARLGKLAVMEFEDDSADDLLVILDVRRPEDPESFETACRMACYLLHQRWDAGQQARLSLGDELAGGRARQNGRTSRPETLAALARAAAGSRRSLTQSVFDLLSVTGPIRSAVIVTTRQDADTREALAALAQFNVEATAIAAETGGIQSREQADAFAQSGA